MVGKEQMFAGSPEVYDRFVGRYSPALAAEMCRAISAGPGLKVLDVGCGPGALLKALADAVGPANVTGLEPSETFAAAARVKVPEAKIVIGAAESLPFEDGAFDATLSQLVVNFLSDPAKGVGEMARVTRRGGVVAGCVWDYSGGMTMVRTFWEAAIAVDGRAAAFAEAHTMRFSTPEELEELWTRVGLAGVETDAVDVEARYDDFDDLWSPFPTGVGPAGAYAASLEEDAREALRLEYRRRLGEPAGAFTLSARAWRVRGLVS